MFNHSTVEFLQQLALNNNREWFNAHKAEYQQQVLFPTQDFADKVAEQLRHISAYPLESKIFRINRDIRFSKDKTPYHAYTRVGFYYHKNPCSPGFYFSIENNQIICGAGLFQFEKAQLFQYQQAVIDDIRGAQLEKILAGLIDGYELRYIEKYKKIPCGLTTDFARSELLKNKGMALWHHQSIKLDYSWDNLAAEVLTHYKNLLPLFNWLAENLT